jgi:hypothetical protein
VVAHDEEPDLETALRALVDDYRDRCLWFLRSDFYPSDRKEILRTIGYIERYGDRRAFERTAEIRRWLSRHSSASSVVS